MSEAFLTAMAVMMFVPTFFTMCCVAAIAWSAANIVQRIEREGITIKSITTSQRAP